MKQSHSHIVIVLLAIIFIAPGIFAYYFYLHPQWLGDASTNKGRLLRPPILFAHLQTKRVSANSNSHTNFTARLIELPTGPKWHLILWSPVACEQSCKVELEKLARIRLALGRHLYEVDSQLILGPNTPVLPSKLQDTLNDQGIGIQKLTMPELTQMPIFQKKLTIFIANPDNYLVLAYEASMRPDDIFHDLKQLLKR